VILSLFLRAAGRGYWVYLDRADHIEGKKSATMKRYGFSCE